MSATSKNDSFDWQITLTQTYSEFLRDIQQVVPQLLTALLVLIVGFITAYLMRVFVHRLIYGF